MIILSNAKRIEELKKEIAYEKKRLECCAYGKSDLIYLGQLQQELEELTESEE